MARLLRIVQRKLYASSPSSSSSSSIRTATHVAWRCVHSRDAISTSLQQIRPYGAEAKPKSPFESNILRILRNEIQYQSEYAPPEQEILGYALSTTQDPSNIPSFYSNESTKNVCMGAKMSPLVMEDSVLLQFQKTDM